jgi:hypothetical protein
MGSAGERDADDSDGSGDQGGERACASGRGLVVSVVSTSLSLDESVKVMGTAFFLGMLTARCFFKLASLLKFKFKLPETVGVLRLSCGIRTTVALATAFGLG